MESENKRIILTAEDDAQDFFLFQHAFQRAGLPVKLHRVENGREAVRYISGEGEYADREKFPLPILMLLDLKMPVMDGFEVLKWIKSQPRLKKLPVIVLTSSTLPRDIDLCYELGANSFASKPVEFDDMEKLFVALSSWWVKCSATPGWS